MNSRNSFSSLTITQLVIHLTGALLELYADDTQEIQVMASGDDHDMKAVSLAQNGDTLTLSAVHQQEQVDKSKEHYICRERSYGSYQRRFDISGIDADQIEAEYKNGILYMVLPKKQPKVPANRRLEIR
mgnify:CR=1 FL=1